MKKGLIVFVCLLSLLSFNGKVGAAPIGSSGMEYSECIAFTDRYGFKNISREEGSIYFTQCYRASCDNGQYGLANMVGNSAYSCANGNRTPYVKITSDGCSRFKGTCRTQDSTYCTNVRFVDCNRQKDGSKYVEAVQSTTRRTTTRKKTTKTTTAKTTRKTTYQEIPTIGKTTKKTSVVGTTKTTKQTTNKITNNTNITKITMNDVDIKYKNDKQEYTVKLPFDVESVDVKVFLEDANSKYEVTGNTNMPNEEHNILITVIASDGTKKVVTIHVNRYKEESKDCTLANIHIEGYNIDFSKNVRDYKLSLPKNVTSLDIDAVVTDEEHATFEIHGNEKLKNRSKIELVVTSEDKTECVYTIKIKKSSNTWKYILLILLLLGALGVSVYFLFKYLKKSKGKYKYE